MKRFFLLSAIIALSLFWCSESIGQKLNLEGLETKIESLVHTGINDTTPGLAIGVVHQGELIFSKGYGLANLSYGIPNDSEIVYNLGSVSKQFLGYAFALLHSEGKLDIDDPVGKYLDDWPEFEKKVSLRNLLTHTSGYREAYTMSSLAGRPIGVDRLTQEECLEVVRRQPKLEFTPGSRYTYNSTAWVILAEVLEQVTGQPAHEWVKENVLIPLGMKNTHIESFVGEVIPNAAESYFIHDGFEYGNSASNRAIFGAADVYSSIEDLTLWLNNLRAQKVGDKSAMELFLTPFILNDGTNSEYCLGIRNSLHKGLRVYSHTGSHESFLTQIRYYPDNDFGIVTISNFGGIGWVPTEQIAEYVLEDFMKNPPKVEYPQFNISQSKLEQYQGAYLSSLRNGTVGLAFINDTLNIWGGTALIPISENRFYSDSYEGEFEFIKGEDQSIQLIIHGDAKSEYQKIDPWSPTPEELIEYQADYHSKELETAYHLEVKNGKLVAQHRWLREIHLIAIAHDLFHSGGGFFLDFQRSKEGEIAGFNIHSNRTLNVFFDKE